MSDLRALVASKHWKWMPGMTVNPVVRWPRGFTRLDARIVAVDPKRAPWSTAGYLDPGEWLPDLEDDATKGCLLRLVRDAWGEPKAHVMPCYEEEKKRWRVWFDDNLVRWFEGNTEAEALVAALLAAP